MILIYKTKISFFICAFISVMFVTKINAQQTQVLTGKVQDNNNYPVTNIEGNVLDSGTNVSKTFKIDLDGNFTIFVDSIKHPILVFNVPNYEPKIIGGIDKNSTADINIFLEKKSKIKDTAQVEIKEEEEVLVTTSRRKESINSTIATQRNINLIGQVVGADFIKRLPDRNVAEVLKRTPGTSLQDNKYIIIRGMSDRYNQVILNGNLMSSTDPDRKVFSFDILPSSMIETLIIAKSFVSENSGDVAGGIVNITTKDIPTKSFLQMQVGTGFNTQTIGKKFLTNPGGSLEWLGFEDGTRTLNNNFPTKEAMFKMSQSQKNEAGKTIYNDWSIDPMPAPIFYSAQIHTGYTKRFSNSRAIGIIYSLVYTQRNITQQFARNVFQFPNADKAELAVQDNNNRYNREVNLSSMLNLSWKINNNHKITLKNLGSILSKNTTLTRDGINIPNLNYARGEEFKYNSNNFFSSQLGIENNFPKYNIKINVVGGYTTLYQIVPGQKRVNYVSEDLTLNSSNINHNPGVMRDYVLEVGSYSVSPGSAFNFYSTLTDNIYFSKIDIIKKYTINNQDQFFKIGGLYQYKNRNFIARPFGYPVSNAQLIKEQDLNTLFAHKNWGTAISDIRFDELADKQYLYSANAALYAGYIQSENTIVEKLKLVFGVRIEYFNQQLAGFSGNTPVPASIVKTNLLPAININYAINKKTNIRMAYSQTVARPEFRETASFSFYDFDLNASIIGSPKLTISEIKNVDLRYEYYPSPGEIFNIGLFMKLINKPIEQYFNDNGSANRSFDFFNADKGMGYGAEMEIRKKMNMIGLPDFTLWGNVSYLYNRVVSQESNVNRPIQGLSPYLINVGLQYEKPQLGFMANILFNIIGRRILYVGSDIVPNIWEAPRPLLDLQASKKILKDKVTLQLSITNILNPRAIFYHDLNQNETYDSHDALFISRNDGTNITFTINYNIL